MKTTHTYVHAILKRVQTVLSTQSYLHSPPIQRFRAKHVHNMVLKTSDGLEAFLLRYWLSENAEHGNRGAEGKGAWYQTVENEVPYGYTRLMGHVQNKFLPPRRIGM